jgi:Tol biopolymer transport system component
MDSDNGDPNGGNGAIHLVSSQGGAVRTIVSDGRPRGINRGHPLWSPDGSHLVYGQWCDNDCTTGEPLADNIGNTVQTYIVGADGKGAHPLPSPAGDFQAPESWSNDGSKVLVIRGPVVDGTGYSQPVAIAVDGVRKAWRCRTREASGAVPRQPGNGLPTTHRSSERRVANPGPRSPPCCWIL